MTLRLEDLDLLEPHCGDSPTPANSAAEQARAVAAGVPLQLPLDLIDEDPDQPRKEFAAEPLQELAASIERRGVIEPISVRPHPHPHPNQPQRWMLNFGARRLRASKLAGKSDIRAFVDPGFDSYDQVIENEQREPLKPLELALFIQQRLALGETQTLIAKNLGKSQPYVAYASALIDAPAWLMTLYRQGRCTGMTELYQLRRLRAQAPELVENWVEQHDSIGRKDVLALKTRLTADMEPGAQRHGTADAATDSKPMLSDSTRNIPAPVADLIAGGSGADRSARREPTARTQGKRSSHDPAFALMVRKGDDEFEMVLDEVATQPEDVVVRNPGNGSTACLRAAELVLIGFRSRTRQ